MGSGVKNVMSELFGWAVCLGCIVAGVFWFDDLRNAARSVLGPSADAPAAMDSSAAGWDRTVRIAADARGHFALDGDVDGQTLTFMADTGATVVALTFEDAERIGLAPATLDFSAKTRTANGEARVAPVVLDRLTVGEIELRDVEAIVMAPGKLGVNLLGMSFLGRLARFTIEDGALVLTQ